MNRFDHIRIEGDGEGDSPAGFKTRVFRNGAMIPGLKSFSLESSVDGVNLLTTTQVVVLDDEHQDIVEEATQALEEREALWRGVPERPAWRDELLPANELRDRMNQS